MSRSAIIEAIEKSQLKPDLSAFAIGDTVRVHSKIVEGSKERVQVFEGTVIARKGTGLSETFTVYRIAYGQYMEKVFLVHSPRVVKVEVMRLGKVRRAKLYYLRGATGKSARVKERIVSKKKRAAKVSKIKEAPAVVEAPTEEPTAE